MASSILLVPVGGVKAEHPVDVETMLVRQVLSRFGHLAGPLGACVRLRETFALRRPRKPSDDLK